MATVTPTAEMTDVLPIPAEVILGIETRAYLFSVQQFKQMVEAGILTTRDRVVLIEGRIVQKMTTNPPHVLANRRTLKTLWRLTPPGWFVAKDDPIETLRSVPEPDITLIRGVEEDYHDRIARPEDIGLVVEVSDSSLKADQTYMKRIYAGAAIPVYWIVNIPERRLEAHADPTGPAEAPDYRRREVFGQDDHVPLILDGREVARVAVRDLLP